MVCDLQFDPTQGHVSGYDCPLCDLLRGKPALNAARSSFVYDGEGFIIADCPVCGLPMAVYKEHFPSISVEVEKQIRATLVALFGAGHKLDRSTCSLTGEHCHIHIAPGEQPREQAEIPETETITRPSIHKAALRSLGIADFVPYELDDLGVIIPHCSAHPKRWAWFWPNYVAVTHPSVLKNTLVVYHSSSEEQLKVPPDVRIVEKTSSLAVIERMGESIAWSTQLGLERNHCRIIARVANDVRFKDSTWAQDVLTEFNREPHFKILAKIVASPDGGPPYDKLKKVCYAPWMHRLLRHGDYDRLPFICGQIVIMNRPLWLGYYSLVSEYTLFEREDIYLSLFARADGVQVVDYTSQFHHCGIRGQDGICEEGGT